MSSLIPDTTRSCPPLASTPSSCPYSAGVSEPEALIFSCKLCHCHSSTHNLQWLPVSLSVKGRVLRTVGKVPCTWCSITSHSYSRLLFFRHTGHLAVDRTFQAHFLRKAFALVVPSARNSLPRYSHTALSPPSSCSCVTIWCKVYTDRPAHIAGCSHHHPGTSHGIFPHSTQHLLIIL